MAICYLLKQRSTGRYSPGGSPPVKYMSEWPKLWSNLKAIRTHVFQAFKCSKMYPDNEYMSSLYVNNLDDF